MAHCCNVAPRFAHQLRNCLLIGSTRSMSVMFWDLRTLSWKSCPSRGKSKASLWANRCLLNFSANISSKTTRCWKSLFILQSTEANKVLRRAVPAGMVDCLQSGSLAPIEMKLDAAICIDSMLTLFSGLTHFCWRKQVPSFRTCVFSAVIFRKRCLFPFPKFTKQDRNHRSDTIQSLNTPSAHKHKKTPWKYTLPRRRPCPCHTFASRHASFGGTWTCKRSNANLRTGRWWPHYRLSPQASFSCPFSSYVLVQHPN